MSSQRRVSSLTLYLATGVTVVAAVVLLTSSLLDAAPRPLVWMITIGFTVLTFCLAFAHWRSLDEASREAHKAAWYWGGSGGMGAAMVAGGYVINDETLLRLLPSQEPSWLFASGMVVCIACQMIGYTGAWMFWWLSKR